MSLATYHVGDVFDVLRTLPDDSVDLVLTSPPFLALRSYLPDDHPDKGREIGQEPTPAGFLDTLLALTAEWDRVLAPHGSVAVELGDTYAGGGGGPDANHAGSVRPVNATHGKDWPLAKSLCGIPELYAFSLAYGRNLLTGEESPAGMWRVRNLVRWVRPNPPVGALGDKFRPATSTMTVACRSRTRWFDLDAVRSEPSDWTKHYAENPYPGSDKATGEAGKKGVRSGGLAVAGDAAGKTLKLQGAPPLDWWEVPTSPYKGSHYATWPPALCVRPIESMCPREVCRTCGEPRRRVVESVRILKDGTIATTDFMGGDKSHGINHKAAVIKNFDRTDRTTLGWTDCGHDDYRRGVVLDPFAGSGTTLAVATGHGRDAVGIDLDERNADLARNRVGMFLEVVER